MRKTTRLCFPLGLFCNATWTGPLAAELNDILASPIDVSATPLSEIRQREAHSQTQMLQYPKRVSDELSGPSPAEAQMFVPRAG